MARARDPRRFGAAEAVRRRLAAERRAGDARRRWQESQSLALAVARKLDRVAASRAAATAATVRLRDQNGRSGQS